MSILCTFLGIWCVAGHSTHTPPKYEDRARIVLPIEAFGANWKVQNFRKKVLFPDNVDTAVARAIYAANSYGEATKLPITITFAPRWYRPRHPIYLTENNSVFITLTGPNINLINNQEGIIIDIAAAPAAPEAKE